MCQFIIIIKKKKLNFVCRSELSIRKQALGAHDMEIIWKVCKSCTIFVFGCFSGRHFDVLIFLNITGLWQTHKLQIVCIHWPINNSNTTTQPHVPRTSYT